MGAIDFFCSGSLLFSIGYFIYTKEWSRRNVQNRGILDTEGRDKKVLFRDWENKFDCKALLVVFADVVQDCTMQCMVLVSH